MRVKVLHVIDNLKLGGAQVSLNTIIDNIDDSIENIICVLRSKPEETKLNGNVIKLIYKRWDPRVFWKIIKICREYNINILHPHLQKSIICSLLASFAYKCPVIVHVRGGVFLRGFEFFIYRNLLRLLRSKGTIFIANSSATKSKLVKRIKINHNKIRVIYNPVDFSKFQRNEGKKEITRKKLGFPREQIVLGYVGRLHQVKGVDLIIKALKILLSKGLNYRLLIAGDGPERSNLETMTENLGISDKVKFLGRCSDVPEIMQDCDIGLIPSRHEPFGRVAVEFMRMKVPIISSGKDGLAELVENEVTGLVTLENTPEEIAKAVERLEKDNDLRIRLISKAFDFSQQFDSTEHVKKIKEIYQAILNPTQ